MLIMQLCGHHAFRSFPRRPAGDSRGLCCLITASSGEDSLFLPLTIKRKRKAIKTLLPWLVSELYVTRIFALACQSPTFMHFDLLKANHVIFTASWTLDPHAQKVIFNMAVPLISLSVVILEW